MPKMKINLGTPSSPNWVVMDAKDAVTLQGKNPSDFSLVGHGHSFSSLTSKPTTLAGYGISDNIVISESNSIKPRWDSTLGAIRMKVDTTDNLPVALAKSVNGIELRMNAGNLEFNDGTGWKLVAGSPIKSVQRGTTNVGQTGSTSVTISFVNMGKTMVNNLGGSDAAYSTEIVLTSSTSLSVSAANNVVVSWEVIEFN